MKIAREGYSVIAIVATFTVLLTTSLFFLAEYTRMPYWSFWCLAILLFLNLIAVSLFFRQPTRRCFAIDTDVVFSSVDGEVVVIEEVFEKEYLKERCLQISVFMSIFNIHANWSPVGGKVIYRKNHEGTFLVAWHPKSSEENERTTTVVDTGREKILFRQIAGYVARRIVNHLKEGDTVSQGAKFGFIKFGSRIDIFLPLGSEPSVKLGDKVVGGVTPVARLKR